ncbi:hypothetical protein AC249_AIPGENE18700 [Exaiptasia diaphana]|nr:hypothetical protein AC249_AIPGENE18700 [Exaiptasia diaphana]
MSQKRKAESPFASYLADEEASDRKQSKTNKIHWTAKATQIDSKSHSGSLTDNQNLKSNGCFEDEERRFKLYKSGKFSRFVGKRNQN